MWADSGKRGFVMGIDDKVGNFNRFHRGPVFVQKRFSSMSGQSHLCRTRSPSFTAATPDKKSPERAGLALANNLFNVVEAVKS